MMAVPFNFMPEEQLDRHFSTAGFRAIGVQTCEMDLVFCGGVEEAYETVYATPIGPKLRELPEERQTRCRGALLSELAGLTKNGQTRGKMASLVLTAEKAR